MNFAQVKDDDLLMEFAKNHTGNIDSLLQSFFRFLHERTDLYVVSENPEKLGFKPGQAESKVLQAFRKFPYKKASEKEPPKQRTDRPTEDKAKLSKSVITAESEGVTLTSDVSKPERFSSLERASFSNNQTNEIESGFILQIMFFPLVPFGSSKYIVSSWRV